MTPETIKPLFKKVLVIDDNETDRYIAKYMIQKYLLAEETITTELATKALTYLKSLEYTPDELPQLIFLDIRMPEMDGFEFLEAYEELPESVKSKCIILLLSTSLDPDDHEKAKSSRYIYRFMNKPLSKESITELEKDLSGKMMSC